MYNLIGQRKEKLLTFFEVTLFDLVEQSIQNPNMLVFLRFRKFFIFRKLSEKT
jgi:hypothetical protein